MTALEPRPSDRNRRAAARYRVSTRAKIRCGDEVMACSVLDISKSGAGLLLTADAAVPDAFDLLTRSGAIHPVTVVWRAYPRCGVAFAPNPADQGRRRATRQAVVEPGTARGYRRAAPLLIGLCLVIALALVWYALATSPPR